MVGDRQDGERAQCDDVLVVPVFHKRLGRVGCGRHKLVVNHLWQDRSMLGPVFRKLKRVTLPVN